MTEKELTIDQERGSEEPHEELDETAKLMARLKEAITVERSEIGPLRLKLSITVPRDTMDERLNEQMLELKKDAQVPGFRKGHAPLRLVEKRFGSDVGDQLKTQFVSTGYMAAVEKEGLKPLGDPLIWVRIKEERAQQDKSTKTVEAEKLLPLDLALEHIKLPKDGSFTFACELELKPEFELPKLERIPAQRPNIAIDDDDVDSEINRFQMLRGTYQPVEDGAIEADDLLYTSYRMTVGSEVIDSAEDLELSARDSRIKGIALVGLGDKLVGSKIGDEVSFTATVPEDHENVDIRGKKAKFSFTIREVKRFVAPPIDKEFLVATGFDSEEDLRTAVRNSLESRLDRTLKNALRDQIAKFLADHTKLEIPEGLSQRQTDRSIERRRMQMYQSGVPESEIAKSVDDMRSKAHDQVVHDLKLFFILEKIAEEQKIEVGEEELNGAIASIAAQSHKRFDRVRDELSKGNGLTTLYVQLRDEKVLDKLLKDAEITETEGPQKKSPSKPKKTTEKKAEAAPKAAAASAKKASKTPPSKTAGKTAKKKTSKKG